MRRNLLYLKDIVDSADWISQFLDGVTEETFHASELLQSAVLHKLMIVGEAATQLDTALRDRNPQVPWRQIIGFRNIVVHSYFSVWISLVWVAATQEVPALREEVFRILSAEEAAENTPAPGS